MAKVKALSKGKDTLMQLRGCEVQDAGQGVGQHASRLCRMPSLVHDDQLQDKETCGIVHLLPGEAVWPNFGLINTFTWIATQFCLVVRVAI